MKNHNGNCMNSFVKDIHGRISLVHVVLQLALIATIPDHPPLVVSKASVDCPLPAGGMVPPLVAMLLAINNMVAKTIGTVVGRAVARASQHDCQKFQVRDNLNT